MTHPYLLLFLTALAWSTHWIVARAFIADSSPIGMAFWRWAAAIAILAPFALPALRRDWRALRRAWLPILFFGTCGTVLYNSIGYYGIRQSSATNAALFQSLAPAWIPLAAWGLFREPIRPLTATGLALSFAGVLVVVGRLDPDVLASLKGNPGDLWLVANTALWGLYTACLRWQPRSLDPVSFMFAVMLAGMLTGLPAYLLDLAAGSRLHLSWQFGLAMAYLGGICSVLAYAMWNRAVASVGAARAGACLHLIPLLAAALAIAFLGETLHTYHVAGFVLILAGVWLTSRGRRG